MNIVAFLDLKPGDSVQFKGRVLMVNGLVDLIDHKEPSLIDEDGRTVNGAVYAAHLMTYLGPVAEYQQPEPAVPANEPIIAVAAPATIDGYDEDELVAWEQNELI